MPCIVCNIKTQCLIDFQGFWKEYNFSQKVTWVRIFVREKKKYFVSHLSFQGVQAVAWVNFLYSSVFWRPLFHCFEWIWGFWQQSQKPLEKLPVEMVRVGYNAQGSCHLSHHTPSCHLLYSCFCPLRTKSGCHLPHTWLSAIWLKQGWNKSLLERGRILNHQAADVADVKVFTFSPKENSRDLFFLPHWWGRVFLWNCSHCPNSWRQDHAPPCAWWQLLLWNTPFFPCFSCNPQKPDKQKMGCIKPFDTSMDYNCSFLALPIIVLFLPLPTFFFEYRWKMVPQLCNLLCQQRSLHLYPCFFFSAANFVVDFGDIPGNRASHKSDSRQKRGVCAAGNGDFLSWKWFAISKGSFWWL